MVDWWNGLPVEIAKATTMNAFKNQLDSVMHSYMYSVEEPPTRVQPLANRTGRSEGVHIAKIF
jgi:hypothetical protein